MAFSYMCGIVNVQAHVSLIGYASPVLSINVRDLKKNAKFGPHFFSWSVTRKL